MCCAPLQLLQLISVNTPAAAPHSIAVIKNRENKVAQLPGNRLEKPTGECHFSPTNPGRNVDLSHPKIKKQTKTEKKSAK